MEKKQSLRAEEAAHPGPQSCGRSLRGCKYLWDLLGPLGLARRKESFLEARHSMDFSKHGEWDDQIWLWGGQGAGGQVTETWGPETGEKKMTV